MSVVSWRWTYWVGLIVAGVSLLFLSFLPETYGPTILKRRAQKLRTERINPSIYAPIELEKKGAKQMITVTLMRPLNMFLFEAIVLFSCLYLSLAYAIFCRLPRASSLAGGADIPYRSFLRGLPLNLSGSVPFLL